MRWSYSEEGSGGLLHSAGLALREKGPFYLLRVGALWASFPIWRRLVPARAFTLDGRRYECFFHNHNVTWANERCIELPIAFELVRECRGRILEVGNVLSHYIPISHTVVDKFERGPRVINEDAVTFRGDGPYDLILSVSTLEHVGWDDEPREPRKVLHAIDNLVSQLAPGGRLVATLPLGYNPGLDALLAAGEVPFTRMSCLKRQGLNTWTEVPWSAVQGSAYDDGRWPGTMGLVVGWIERQ